MKKIILIALGSILLTGLSAYAAGSRTADGLSEGDQLAITAGVALACGADDDKLATYEMIASRILVNPTRSDKEENAVLTAYAQSKLRAYQEQKKAPEMSCQEVLNRFYKLPLFKSTVYRDGTLKLPDGKKIKPVRPVQPTAPKKIPAQTMDSKKTPVKK